MTAPETWRVECADGVVHEVERDERDVSAGGERLAHKGDPRTAVLRLALAAGWPVVAIHAPGEPTTAERVAAAVRDGMHRGLALAQEHAAAVADGDDGAPAIDWTDAIAALGDALAGGAS